MARPLRIELAGGVYHVTSRGDRRETIFGDDADRRAWVDLFGEVCERFNWRCHAWCQMGNHYQGKLWGQVFHFLTRGPRMRVLFPLRS